MERICAAFAESSPHAALMPYFTIGYPNPQISLEVVEAIALAGADLIELGIPFSDPLADGPTIQHSTQVALEAGITVPHCLEFVADLRGRGIEQPIFLMGYINPILAYGMERFVQDAVGTGVDGFIVPDLPADEAQRMEEVCDAVDCPMIYMLAPTSSQDRIRWIVDRARGFLYLVSVVGTTGARSSLSETLEQFVASIRRRTDLPLAVGFGISTPQQAQVIGKISDGVIVGSALIEAVGNAKVEEASQVAATFVREMKLALKRN